MAGVLSGVRVLDLSRVVSGPWCTQILADLGAEVIKIERPVSGDDTRQMGPFLEDADREPTDNSAIYMACNRGKRSVTVDIASKEGADLIRELARGCDVFVENFKAGALKKFGLDYESIRAVRDDIVYCSITGFGQDGPYAARPAYDFVMQAMSGLMSTVGPPEGAPGSQPMRTAVPLTDMVTGLYATIAIQAALYHRQATGQGQFIDAAMLDSAVAFNGNLAVNFLLNGKVPKRNGNTNAVVCPSDVFAAEDGDIVLAISNDAQFRSFCALIDMPALADDARFRTNTARFSNRAALYEIISPPLKTAPMAIWLARCAKANVPCGPINHMHEVFADAQVRHREIAIQLPHGTGQKVRLVRSPLRLSQTPVDHRPPPLLGADTDAVLGELGRSPEEIEKLRKAGVL
ncbi:MAG TPA: CaiB/BaiF CoA-transferase family protein [Rhodoblastus sp.]|nr:CaiB/BaiF CoA-transferase family protein [Rhodoblastus sp.]